MSDINIRTVHTMDQQAISLHTNWRLLVSWGRILGRHKLFPQSAVCKSTEVFATSGRVAKVLFFVTPLVFTGCLD